MKKKQPRQLSAEDYLRQADEYARQRRALDLTTEPSQPSAKAVLAAWEQRYPSAR